MNWLSDNYWDQYEERQQRKPHKNRQNISGQVSGLYSHDTETQGARGVSMRRSARVNGKLVTDREELRESDKYQQANRKERDRMMHDFHRKGARLTDDEASAFLKKNPDGSFGGQKDVDPKITPDGMSRSDQVNRLIKFQDMTVKVQEANENVREAAQKRDEAIEQKEEFEDKDRDSREEESDNEAPPPEGRKDDTDEGYQIEDAVSAYVDASNPYVRKSHVSQSIDQEVMGLLAQIEGIGGGV